MQQVGRRWGWSTRVLAMETREKVTRMDVAWRKRTRALHGVETAAPDQDDSKDRRPHFDVLAAHVVALVD